MTLKNPRTKQNLPRPEEVMHTVPAELRTYIDAVEALLHLGLERIKRGLASIESLAASNQSEIAALKQRVEALEAHKRDDAVRLTRRLVKQVLKEDPELLSRA